jgi:hypothetical protein
MTDSQYGRVYMGGKLLTNRDGVPILREQNWLAKHSDWSKAWEGFILEPQDH